MNSYSYLDNSLYSFERTQQDNTYKKGKTNLQTRSLNEWMQRSGLNHLEFLKRLKEYNLDEKSFTNILLYNENKYPQKEKIKKIIESFLPSYNNYDFIEGIGEFLIPYINYFDKKIDIILNIYSKYILVKDLKKSLIKSLYFSLKNFSDKTIVLEFQKELDSNKKMSIESYKKNYLKNKKYHKFLLEKYPVLYRCLFETIEQELDNVEEFLKRLTQDYSKISITFFDNEKLYLRNISKDVGDTHNNGRSVIICNFENNKSIVYKPRSLKIDQAFSNLISKLNKYNNILYKLTTIKTIENENYGWQEYIEHKECHDEKDVYKCYYRLGVLLGIMYTFKTNDMHYENIIISSEDPYIIDLETFITNRRIFKINKENPIEKLINSIYSTSMLPTGRLFPSYVDNDISALTGTPNQKSSVIKNWIVVNDNTDNVHFEHKPFITQEDKHLLKLNGNIIDPSKYLSIIVNGFESLYKVIMENKENFCSFIEENFSNCTCRTIIRSTYTYSKFLNASYHPNYLSNGLNREFLFELLWDKIKEDKKFFPIVKYEIQSLLNNDIPYFSFNTSSTNLIINNHSIFNFFEDSAINNLKKQIINFCEEDLYLQKRFICNSLNNYKLQNYSIDFIESGLSKSDLNITKNSLPYYVANKIINNNLITSLNEKNSLWIGLEIDSNNNKYNLSTLDFSIYNGVLGVVIFLSEMYLKTKNHKYLNPCITSMNFITNNIESNIDNLSPSMFNGIGGLSYVYFYLYEITDKDYFKKLGEHYFNIMIQKIRSTNFKELLIDFLDGLSGNIVFCLELYERYQDKDYLKIAYKLSKQLENKIYDSNEESFLTGMGHGVSGIILAFKKIYIYFEEFYSIILKLVTYEDNNFDESILNWKDLRNGKSINNDRVNYWCHGRPGILLGRYYSFKNKSILKEDILEKTMERALKQTKIMDRFGLCHGVFGNIEIFKYIYQQFNNMSYHKKLETLQNDILSHKDLYDNVDFLLKNNLIGLMTGCTGIALSILKGNKLPIEVLLLRLPYKEGEKNV